MITPEHIQEYISFFTSPQSDLLTELEKETYQKMVLPQMISGAYQGRLLSLLSKLKQPENILEVGTFTGFATLCLAEGLRSTGVIHTIDINDEFQSIQNKYFEKSGYKKQIKQYLGNARDIIPQIPVKFDLVFLDADKQYYPEYYQLIQPKMKKNGLIIADNVLWYEKVLDKNARDAETKGLKKYNEILKNAPNITSIILPVRDGISLAIVN